MGRVIHFEIHAADPARAIAFYERMFAWRFQQWGDLPYWLIVTGEDGTPGINGGLVPRRGPAPVPGQAVNAFACTVEVDDLDAQLALARDAGATMALERMPIPGVGWLAYIHDTEGNLVGLMQSDSNAA
jgi:predicted enzyme related to lactoylglutathione lyase